MTTDSEGAIAHETARSLGNGVTISFSVGSDFRTRIITMIAAARRTQT
jgi:hypothetical protein